MGVFRKLSILVVDDELSIRRVIRRHLVARGHDVVEVGGGALALEALGEREFDALIVDLRMPEIDGLTVTTRARAALGRESPAIWIMTGSIEADLEIAARRAGADALVLKPFKGDDLDQWLAALQARSPGTTAD